MRVDVTEAHIADCDHARPLRCLACPVALALFKATNQAWIVSPEVAVPIRGTMLDAVKLPKATGERIRRWDETGAMEPFGFEFRFVRSNREGACG